MIRKIDELFKLGEQTRQEWEEWIISDREYAERMTDLLGKVKAELNGQFRRRSLKGAEHR